MSVCDIYAVDMTEFVLDGVDVLLLIDLPNVVCDAVVCSECVDRLCRGLW